MTQGASSRVFEGKDGCKGRPTCKVIITQEVRQVYTDYLNEEYLLTLKVSIKFGHSTSPNIYASEKPRSPIQHSRIQNTSLSTLRTARLLHFRSCPNPSEDEAEEPKTWVWPAVVIIESCPS